ncbi:hypothetical protein K438DRAFT_2020903 [Mycena galopus ATCC 62051]|nr:hypothetical protein K438DRAFT_2020903 [Mycena galopus ATCC 62051]
MAVQQATNVPTDPTQQTIIIPTLPDSTRSSGTSTTITFDAPSGTPPTPKSKQRNSAARRASHNAVERLRRENLNSRFLDLAALFPNLANIRRPTKSSIVNTCIAHVHASRRHRFMASQQLRALKEECDSLRREANEWRERAGVVPLPPPNRGEVFEIILAGVEFDLDAGDLGSGEGEDEDYGDEDGGGGPRYTREDLARLEIYNHQRQQQQQQHFQGRHPNAHTHAHPAAQFQSPFAHNIPPPPSAHSAGVPDGPWNDEHPWYDDHPFPPHSAHEPVMRHPYMHRLQSAHPPPQQQLSPPQDQRASPEHLSPLFPAPEYPYDPLAHHQLPRGQQIHIQDGDQKWEFVSHTRPEQRLHRKSTR